MTESMGGFFGRNVSYAKDKHKTYDRLTRDSQSPFKGRSMVDVFVSAAVAGFLAGKRSKLKKKIPNISSVAMSPEQKSILLTIAITNEGTLDILFDKRKAIEVIEEYANAGICILEAEIPGSMSGDPIQIMALQMKESTEL